MKHYLLKMLGDVEPEIAGPFATQGEVFLAARRHRAEDTGMEDGLYGAKVDSHGNLEIVAFAAWELAVD